MQIDTRAFGFSLTDALRGQVEARVGPALGPVAWRVMSVAARLDDVNAGRGGVDKRCRLVATLRDRTTVVTEAVDADLYAAIDHAAARLRRAALAAVERHAARERRGRPRVGSAAGA